MYKLITIVAVILCAASANALTYEWTDRAGVVHFTDSPENIPPAYLQHVIKKDDITIRDPKIREEIRLDKERAQQEESASISGNAVEPAPVPRNAAQSPSENQSPKPEVKSPEPVWNLCAPGRPLNIACAPGPLKKKGG
jgi:hypothetical protein